MKARAWLGLALLFAAVAFWIGACVSTAGNAPHDTTHNVVIHKHTIVLPGTEVSLADHEAMNKILKHYDKSLYRIDTYQNGQRQETQGKLTDLVTDRTLASEIAINVKRKGFTRDVHQVGRRDEISVPAPGGNPSPLKAPNDPTLPTPTPTPADTTASPSPGGNPSPLKPPNSTEVLASPSPGGNPSPLKPPQSEQLVNRLRPILEKYSRR
jgi:hypothetical protein